MPPSLASRFQIIYTHWRPLAEPCPLWTGATPVQLHCAWASAWLLATQHFGWASATAQATPGCWFAEGNLCMFDMVFFLVMEVYWMFFSIACGYLIDHEIDSWFQAIERCSRANRRVCQCSHGPERASIEFKVYVYGRVMTLCKGWKKLESLFVAVLQLFQVSSALPLWISFLSSQQLS